MKSGYPGYDTKLYLMVRFKFWSSGEYPFIVIIPRSTLTWAGSTFLGSHLLISLKVICIQLDCVQKNQLLNIYAKNVNINTIS